MVEKTLKSRALVLQMLGDIRDADELPPENVLFVCRLNSVTESDDLELAFHRFGNIKSCNVVRDPITKARYVYVYV